MNHPHYSLVLKHSCLQFLILQTEVLSKDFPWLKRHTLPNVLSFSAATHMQQVVDVGICRNIKTWSPFPKSELTCRAISTPEHPWGIGWSFCWDLMVVQLLLPSYITLFIFLFWVHYPINLSAGETGFQQSPIFLMWEVYYILVSLCSDKPM